MADIVTNSKARHEYHVLETIEAGIVLHGTEVKSLRGGRGQIGDAFVRIQDGEAFLHNALIDEYEQGNRQNHKPRAARKLLLHRSEIRKLFEAANVKGNTLIPLSLYWKKDKVKVALGVCRGKQQFDKREDLKRRESDRELKRVTMHRLRGK